MTGARPQEEIGGVFEVADLLGVSRTYVSGKIRYMPGFPGVFQQLRSGPVWRLAAVREWADEHWWPTHVRTPAADRGRLREAADALGQPITEQKG